MRMRSKASRCARWPRGKMLGVAANEARREGLHPEVVEGEQRERRRRIRRGRVASCDDEQLGAEGVADTKDGNTDGQQPCERQAD